MIKRRLTEAIARQILEEKKRLLESINLEPSEIEERIAECWQVYLKYKKAGELKGEGYSCSQIAEQLGVKLSRILDWTSNRIPSIFNNKNHFSRLEIKLEGETRQDLLFLFGAFQGKRIISDGGFSRFSSQDRQELETLLLPIYWVFSVVPKITKIVNPTYYWQISFNSARFLAYFNQHTGQDQHLPWGLMPSLEEKTAYFKGYFLKGSAINVKRIVFRFSHEPILKTEFAVLLGELDLVPGCNSREIELSDPVDFKKILNEGWCLSQRKTQALEKIIHQKTNRNNHPPEEILYVLEQIKQKKLTKPEASKEYAIPRKSLQGWIHEGRLPFRVRRYLKLNKMEEMVRTDVRYHYNADIPLKYLFNMFVPEKDFGDSGLIKIHHRSFYRYLKEEPCYSQLVRRNGNEEYIAWEHFPSAERLLTAYLPGYKKRSLEEAKRITKMLE